MPERTTSTTLRRVGERRLRRRTSADLGRWPFRVGICAALAVLAGVAALVQRDALAPVQWPVVALVGLAVLPWVVDLLVVEVPPWLFAPMVLVPVAILHDPARPDPLVLLLAVLALDMGLWLGVARSAPVVVAAAAVLVWPALPGGADLAVRPARALGAVAGAWLVGLALHSQVVRVERARGQRDEVAARLGAVVSGVAAAREELERGEVEQARTRLAAAERRGRGETSGDGGARDGRVSGATGRGGDGPGGSPGPPPSGPPA